MGQTGPRLGLKKILFPEHGCCLKIIKKLGRLNTEDEFIISTLLCPKYVTFRSIIRRYIPSMEKRRRAYIYIYISLFIVSSTIPQISSSFSSFSIFFARARTRFGNFNHAQLRSRRWHLISHPKSEFFRTFQRLRRGRIVTVCDEACLTDEA